MCDAKERTIPLHVADVVDYFFQVPINKGTAGEGIGIPKRGSVYSLMLKKKEEIVYKLQITNAWC